MQTNKEEETGGKTYGEEIIDFLSITISEIKDCEDKWYKLTLIGILSKVISEISEIEKNNLANLEELEAFNVKSI